MQIAVLGYGVVGSGVVELITKNKKIISKNAGTDVDIKYILDIRDFSDSPFCDKFTKDFNVILNDPGIATVVEVMGGTDPSFRFVKGLLEKHKNVVTSNKELVAQHGAELLKTAFDNNVNFLFEAAVGGGIPIIRPLHQCLAANEISSICGILNGTTNYILTKMLVEKLPFETALKQAQDKGYAERNPEADVMGYDTLRKICILASLAYGKHIYPDNILTEGISNIKISDVKIAHSAGYTVKLLGVAKKHSNDKIYIITAPFLIPFNSPLANVEDVFNAILVKGSFVDDVAFYGRGAGKYPTASAVAADVIDTAKHLHARKWLYWEDSDNSSVADYKDEFVKMMIRLKSDSLNELIKTVETLFGNVIRLEVAEKNEFAFLTPELAERDIDSRLSKTSGKIISKIRVL